MDCDNRIDRASNNGDRNERAAIVDQNGRARERGGAIYRGFNRDVTLVPVLDGDVAEVVPDLQVGTGRHIDTNLVERSAETVVGKRSAAKIRKRNIAKQCRLYRSGLNQIEHRRLISGRLGLA